MKNQEKQQNEDLKERLIRIEMLLLNKWDIYMIKKYQNYTFEFSIPSGSKKYRVLIKDKNGLKKTL